MTASRNTKSPPTSAQGFQFTAFLLLALLLSSLTQLLPAGAVPGWSRSGRSAMAVFWPQGWGFFADEPTADLEMALTAGDGDRLIAVPQVQQDLRTRWGLSRSGYARYVELGNLGSLVPAHGWLDCTGLTPSACRDAALRTPLVRVPNRTARPTLCGHLLIVVVSPVRWTADTRLWQSDWKILRAANSSVACGG
ncbi:SdpA family antimicrobial peptide system protein [Kitasatospora sp. NPDC088783]|uniref:SdpA family antimicrobial peptide system protein n=1 Tax=Kitasatospora sp. NPDC088783 TaxID=3364077 RepID=UPI00382FE8DB